LIRTSIKNGIERSLDIIDIITEFVKENEILEYLAYENDIMKIFPGTLYLNAGSHHEP
jgi:hypothetical protein